MYFNLSKPTYPFVEHFSWSTQIRTFIAVKESRMLGPRLLSGIILLNQSLPGIHLPNPYHNHGLSVDLTFSKVLVKQFMKNNTIRAISSCFYVRIVSHSKPPSLWSRIIEQSLITNFLHRFVYQLSVSKNSIRLSCHASRLEQRRWLIQHLLQAATTRYQMKMSLPRFSKVFVSKALH